jgi:hypothetical protein
VARGLALVVIGRGWLDRFLFTGSSGDRLGATRMLLGLGLLPFHVAQYGSLVMQVDPAGPRWFYLDPVWYFDLCGIRSHEPVAVLAAFAALLAATLCFALGFRTRTAAWASLILILFLKGARDSMAGDIHHRELIPFHVLLFFAVSRCGDTLSLDARRPGVRPLAEWEASWPISAAQLYIASFYFWSGMAKLRVAGMSWAGGGSGLQQLLLGRSLRSGMPEDGDAAGGSLALWLAQYPDLLGWLAVGTLTMELGFLALPFVRRLWFRVGFLAGVTFFHVANFVLLKVKFLFLPVVFVTYFDVAPIGRAIAGWLGRKAGRDQS